MWRPPTETKNRSPSPSGETLRSMPHTPRTRDRRPALGSLDQTALSCGPSSLPTAKRTHAHEPLWTLYYRQAPNSRPNFTAATLSSLPLSALPRATPLATTARPLTPGAKSDNLFAYGAAGPAVGAAPKGRAAECRPPNGALGSSTRDFHPRPTRNVGCRWLARQRPPGTTSVAGLGDTRPPRVDT